MQDNDCSVRQVALPLESRISRKYASPNLADAYAIRLPNDAISDPELLARFIFSRQPPWLSALMRLRDALVAGFGVKTSKQLQNPGGQDRARRIYIFKIYETRQHEIVLGEDDRHLDFRLSVLRQAAPSADQQPRLILSTVVHCHNRFGRAYIMLIAPFHRLVVQSSLRRAARAGWPTVGS